MPASSAVSIRTLSCRRLSRRSLLGGLGVAAGLSLCGLPALAQYDVPYVPTPQAVVDAMLNVAKVTASDYVIDLGCGDGRIVVTAARQFGARGLGVDLDPQRIAESNANAAKASVTDKVEFKQQDLFETDISKASVLTMYLLPSVNLKLRPVVLDTLAPGTRVVSHAFDMGDWTPDETLTVEGKRIFFWVVPAKIGGTWRIEEDGGEAGQLVLTQTYQMVDGQRTTKGGSTAVSDGRLTGTAIRFTADGVTYTGKVDGDGMSGTTDTGKPWSARRMGG